MKYYIPKQKKEEISQKRLLQTQVLGPQLEVNKNIFLWENQTFLFGVLRMRNSLGIVSGGRSKRVWMCQLFNFIHIANPWSGSGYKFSFYQIL